MRSPKAFVKGFMPVPGKVLGRGILDSPLLACLPVPGELLVLSIVDSPLGGVGISLRTVTSYMLPGA